MGDWGRAGELARRIMEREGIPHGTDSPVLLALGASPLHVKASRAKAEQEMAATKLLAACRGIDPHDLEAVLAEVDRRVQVFTDHRATTTRTHHRSTPRTVAIESVYQDVIAGRFP